MADDSYEVDVPESVGPVVRLTPGGEPPVELEVTNGIVTTGNADHAQTISRTFGGEVRVNVQQAADLNDAPAVADTDGAENASVLPEDRTDSGDSTDEPELPAEPDNTTRSARKAR